MGTVWEAMRRHRAEQERRAAEASAADSSSSGGPAPPQAPEAPPAAAATPPSDNYAEVLVAYHDRGGRITEQYRALRTNLLAQYADERFCIMVTSAEGGEGKTVSAANLALVMAERQERRTILVDSDLRKGTMAGLLRADVSPGMTDVLRGEAALGDVVRLTVYPNLFFIPAGAARGEEVGELIGRPELGEVVNQLRSEYDYVVFDTPPVNAVSDAGMVGGTVGEALLVVRMNKTRRESVDRAIRLLHAANVKVTGIVLTHQKYYIPNYLYRYS